MLCWSISPGKLRVFATPVLSSSFPRILQRHGSACRCCGTGTAFALGRRVPTSSGGSPPRGADRAPARTCNTRSCRIGNQQANASAQQKSSHHRGAVFNRMWPGSLRCYVKAMRLASCATRHVHHQITSVFISFHSSAPRPPAAGCRPPPFPRKGFVAGVWCPTRTRKDPRPAPPPSSSGRPLASRPALLLLSSSSPGRHLTHLLFRRPAPPGLSGRPVPSLPRSFFDPSRPPSLERPELDIFTASHQE